MSPLVPAPELQITTTRRAPLWTKLFTIAVVVNTLGILVASAMAKFVRAVPATEGAEQGWRFAYYAAIGLAAIVDALLLDEVLFKGSFRRTHLVGKVPGFARRDDDVEAVAVSMQRSTVSFPILVILAGLVTSMGYDLVNGDFESYYREVGKDLGQLRRGDTGQKIAAIRNLSIRRRPEVLPALRTVLDEGGEAAPWAAWAFGRHRDLERRKPLVPPLVAASRSGDPVLRREALLALGRLQQRASAPQLQAELWADLEAGSVDPRLLYALGSVQVTSSAEVLEAVLYRGDPLAQQLAAWAIAQHRDQREAKDMVEILERHLPTADVGLRCAIVHSLGVFSHERSNLALVKAYDSSTPAELATVCARIQVPMSPALPADAPAADVRVPDDVEELLMPDDALALKILAAMGQMRATTPEVRAVVEPWLEARTLDADATAFVREHAGVLLSGIREARNDALKPSVEEALDRR